MNFRALSDRQTKVLAIALFFMVMAATAFLLQYALTNLSLWFFGFWFAGLSAIALWFDVSDANARVKSLEAENEGLRQLVQQVQEDRQSRSAQR